MRTTTQINADINFYFRRNDITVNGPGAEAFWNAVDDLEEVSPKEADAVRSLSDEWDAAFFEEQKQSRS